MKAIVSRTYGSADVLEYADLPQPSPAKDKVVIKAHSASINPLDWHFCTGTPYPVRLVAGLRRPKQIVRGVDVAGVVEQVGSSVTAFAPGDRVFGLAYGAFAEYVEGSVAKLHKIPDGLGFDEAAAIPVAAVTAIQGLRDHGSLLAGQSILINGAAGGVGTYAVQMAKAMGAEVTAVCSTGNVELVRSLGADHVIDYTNEDFAESGRSYDVMLDNVGNRPLPLCRQVLTPTGTYVLISGPKTGKVLGPIKRMVGARVGFLFSKRKMRSFTADENSEELANIAEMFEAGQVRSVIDRHYPLSATADAMRYIETGHAKAKVIIDIG